MINPLAAIIIVSAILVLLILFFLPGKGLISRWRRNTSNTKRVLIEDGLKQLYESEYRRINCSLSAFAKGLSITEDQALHLLDQLLAMNLVEWKQDIPKLTSAGQAYALRVIRIHRLWERYLADETSVKETDWHPEAERREHNITVEEADKLAARLSNPLFDPHGDPIPTASGEIPKHKGKPLTQFEEGEVGMIVHMEDEPPAVYAQLVAEGLHIGKQVRVIEKSDERIKFFADGDECVLAPLLAENLTVELLAAEEVVESDYQPLSLLRMGETAKVVGISAACRGRQRRRLMDFGIVPGAKISAELESLGGDPVAYRIRGTSIALRNQQADKIMIEEIENESEVA